LGASRPRGRAFGFGYERVRAVLSAQGSFDDLTADEQAVALVELEEYLEHLPRDRDEAFFAKLRAAGVPIHGATVRRTARQSSAPRVSRKTARRRA
jgi:hypothetical protein